MRRMKRIWKNKKGITLIELVVSVALLSILVVGATLTISSGIRIYDKVRSRNEAVQVSGMLLDKVRSELAGARSDGGTDVTFDSGKTSASFQNADGSSVTVAAEDGRLQIDYAEVRDDSDQTLYSATKWAFDEKSYMGYALTGLEFTSHLSGYPANVVRVQVTVEKSGGFSYQEEAYVECYNFQDETDNGIE